MPWLRRSRLPNGAEFDGTADGMKVAIRGSMKRLGLVFLAALGMAVLSPTREAAALSCSAPASLETLTLEFVEVEIDGNVGDPGDRPDHTIVLTEQFGPLQLVLARGSDIIIVESLSEQP